MKKPYDGGPVMDEKNLPKYNYFQAAELLNIVPGTLRKWVMDGKVQHYKVGRNVRFSESQIEQILSEMEITV